MSGKRGESSRLGEEAEDSAEDYRSPFDFSAGVSLKYLHLAATDGDSGSPALARGNAAPIAPLGRAAAPHRCCMSAVMDLDSATDEKRIVQAIFCCRKCECVNVILMYVCALHDFVSIMQLSLR